MQLKRLMPWGGHDASFLLLAVLLLTPAMAAAGRSPRFDRHSTRAAARLLRRGTFLTGADVSFFVYIQKHGGVYRYRGKPVGLLKAFKKSECNFLRLRLWHRATAAEVKAHGALNTVNNLAYTVPLARQIKKLGFVFDLDMHFSDSWADPGHQITPAAWQKLSMPALRRRVFAYCKRVITTLRKAGAMPDIVQPGNEISNGILWPHGRVWVKGGPHFKPLCKLLRTAIAGIYAGSGGKKPLILLHVPFMAWPRCRQFFDAMNKHDVHYDMIGMSYYPFWAGPIRTLKNTFLHAARRFKKPLIVAETAYPFTGQPRWFHDRKGLAYPFTAVGQARYAAALVRMLKGLPHGLGRGILWWGAEYNADAKQFKNAPWSYRGLFNAQGNAVPAMRVLGRAARRRN